MPSKVTITITLESDSPINVGVAQSSAEAHESPATAAPPAETGPTVEDVKRELIAAGQRATNAKALKVLKDTTGAAKVSEVKDQDYPKLIENLKEL